MSQAADHLPVNREQLRTRLERIRRSRTRGSLGIAEILGLAVGALLLLAVIVGYLYFLIPAQSRSTSLVRERDRLQKQVRASQETFRRDQDIKTTIRNIIVSLHDFEEKRLVDRGEGRMLLYEDLNGLIHKNALRNTSGPAYAPLEPLGARTLDQATAASSSASSKWQSIYPGIAVNLTVEGQYQNVRHFVRDIESSKEFIIINAVELERAAEAGVQPAAETNDPRSTSGNALVSLRLDLATYFQRSDQASEKKAEPSAAKH
jgi:hypothetical protein